MCRAGGLALFYASATGKVGESWNGLNSWAQVKDRKLIQNADDPYTLLSTTLHLRLPLCIWYGLLEPSLAIPVVNAYVFSH